jgi:hypothetical protein
VPKTTIMIIIDLIVNRNRNCRIAPPLAAVKLPGLDSADRKSFCCNGEATHQQPLAHTLPTSRGQDPDLALIVDVWDRLPENVRDGIVAIVKAALK